MRTIAYDSSDFLDLDSSEEQLTDLLPGPSSSFEHGKSKMHINSE